MHQTVEQTYKVTAHVVASDDKHGLTLLKLDPTTPRLFRWLNCRSAMPTKGQRIIINGSHEATIALVGQTYDKPLIGTDGFTVAPPKGGVIGAPLTSIDHELQGIMLQLSAFGPPADKQQSNNMNVPAIHIEKLVEEYRRVVAEPKH